jgi:hypothetical protein
MTTRSVELHKTLKVHSPDKGNKIVAPFFVLTLSIFNKEVSAYSERELPLSFPI